MSILEKAIKFAAEKHVGQIDKGGHAYILHPLRVMLGLRTSDDELMSIAVLHDVVEDCGVSFDELKDLGMSERVVSGVKSLTRKPSETYQDFIYGMAGHIDALLVKRGDLLENLDLTRLKCVTEKDLERIQKYMHALELVDSLIYNFQHEYYW